MSIRARDNKQKSQHVSLTSNINNDIYAVLRDGKNDELHIVPRKEIISAKKSGEIDVGDVVSHGVRDKCIRATVVLLGKNIFHCSIIHINFFKIFY